MGIAQFIENIEDLLLATTPTYLPEISYKLAPKNAPIEAQYDNGETTERSFQVRAGQLTDISVFSCTNFSTKTEILVIWRYFVGHLQDADKFAELNKMSAEDARTTIAAVLYPATAYNSSFYGIDFVDDSDIQDGENENIFYRVLKFVVDTASDIGTVSEPIETEFDTYDEVYAALVSAGSTSKAAIPLYKKGHKGEIANIIGYWGWNGRYIVPIGPIDFTLATDGGFGIVASVDSATKLTLVSGHTIPYRKPYSFRVCDISDGVELFDGITGTCNGNTLTLPNTTGIEAGDLVYALGRSEFTIGNSTRNFSLRSGAYVKFSNSNLVVGGNGLSIFHQWSKRRWWRVDAECTITDSAPTNGSYAGVGIVGDTLTSTREYIYMACYGRTTNGISQDKFVLGYTAGTLTIANTTNHTGNITRLVLTNSVISAPGANYITPSVCGENDTFGASYTGAGYPGKTEGIATNQVAFIIHPGGTESLSLNISRITLS